MEIVNYGFDQDQRAQMIKELLEGLEYAKQLQSQITNKTISLSDDNQVPNYSSLIETMMSTFNKTISMAKEINAIQFESSHPPAISSPKSESSQPENRRPSKRRKMLPKWTKIVHVSPGKSISGLEGPLDDGLSWRKYGQKEILGAKFPRGYYRCTHRHTKGCPASKQVQQSGDTKGCPASKQVQQSGEDPSIYQVMYKGEHTCNIGPQLTQTHQLNAHSQPQPQTPSSQICQPNIQEVFLGLSPDGDLQIEPNESNNNAQIFRCFSFNSALLEAEPLDNYLSWSLDFTSPTSLDSNYFSTSSHGDSDPYVGLSVQTSDTDINDPISGPNSVTNSPTTGDFEFLLGQWLDLDPNFF